MNYRSLLEDLGRETQLDLAAAAQSGSCTIEFGTANAALPLQIAFEASDHNGLPQTMLHMHTVIGSAPVLGTEALLMRLLQLHVLGFATAQGMFGYDPALRNIVFFKSFSLELVTQTDALKQIESFVNQAERWRDHLPELAASEGPSSFMPDFAMTA